IGTAAKATGEAAKVTLGSWANTAKQFLAHQLRAIPEIGKVAAQQAAAQTVNHISQGVAAILDGQPDASPVSLESAANTFLQVFRDSLAPFTGVIVAG